MLMYVGVVELMRNLPLYGGGLVSPLIRDLESRRHVLTGQSTGWALVNATSRRSLRLLCGEYGQIECKNLYAIWRRNHGERFVYRRDDEKLQCRDGDQANHFRYSFNTSVLMQPIKKTIIFLTPPIQIVTLSFMLDANARHFG